MKDLLAIGKRLLRLIIVCGLLKSDYYMGFEYTWLL